MSAYCRHLEEAYLVSFLPFYTLKSAERLRRPSKVHAIDPGLRNAISLSGAPDRGRLMETAVLNACSGKTRTVSSTGRGRARSTWPCGVGWVSKGSSR